MRRWLRGALLAVIIISLAVPRTDTFRITPVELIAFDHLFSLVEWEIANFPKKWLHAAANLIPGAKPSREERLEIVDEYLQLVRRVIKEERRIEGAENARSFRGTGSAAKQEELSDEYLRELIDRRDALRAEAEEAVESEVSAALDGLGLESRFGLIWPPVDVGFGEPPTLLVISPRNEIDMVGAVFLDPDIEPFERDEIERQVFEDVDYAAYVDDISGLASFPNMVSDVYSMRHVLRTAAHEWMHSYWFFHPFGRNYFASEEMTTLNETAATIVGDEIGDIVFERMGGDLSENARRYDAADRVDKNFTKFMRDTNGGRAAAVGGEHRRGRGVHAAAAVGPSTARLLHPQAEPGILRVPGPLRRQSGVAQPGRRPDGRAALVHVRRRGVHQGHLGRLKPGGVRGAAGADQVRAGDACGIRAVG